MIGTEDMSTSTGHMDISESFRAEDLSKTDFFDFVTSPDLGIGIGVGVGVDVGVSLHHHNQHQQQQQQQQQHHQQQHHQQQHTHHQHQQQQHHLHSHLQQQQQHERLTANSSNSSMTHDADIVAGDSRSGSNNGGGDPTLQGYEQFWHSSDKHTDSSSIFEDLDRYCWQQQQHSTANATASNNSTVSSSHPAHTNSSNTVPTSSTASSGASTASIATTANTRCGSQPGSTVSSIDNSDGQIYTLTVLNGSEPSWLKRSAAESAEQQLSNALDLDSLLGSFPSYIKSEYPYDDSGFSNDATPKDVNGGVSEVGLGGDVVSNGISIPHVGSHQSGIGQTLPSLVTAISIAGGVGVSDLGQQLAQFQNNNNDWHMADHNVAEQNTAESLLRSALQGKGYGKGLQQQQQHMQNGITLLPPSATSPTVKDEEMRRILFTPDADSLSFADSTLTAAQMFDDAQSMNHASHLLVPHSPTTSGVNHNHNNNNANSSNNNAMPSIIVDDMFLSLENAFSDDFEKIKRIANEVQQYCVATTPNSVVDYNSSDIMLQISPKATNATQATQLQQLHSPVSTTPTGQVTTMHMQQNAGVQPPQPLKPEVSTSTGGGASAANATTTRLTGITKPKKPYKRNSSVNSNNNNNNNPNVINHNNSSGAGSMTNSSNVNGSSGSNSSNSNSPPSNCSGASSGGGGNTNNAASNTGQRKERSLHYCAICSKGFKDKYSVNVHIRTHTGEKPFACSLCGKSFRQKAHLAKHYQTHMTQKNNGNLVKGNAAKHSRSSGSGNNGGGNTGNTNTMVGGNATTNTTTVAQQRQLAAVAAAAAAAAAATVGPLPSLTQSLSVSGIATTGGGGGGGGVGGGGGGIATSVMNAGVLLNGPTVGVVLPPANGLLANR